MKGSLLYIALEMGKTRQPEIGNLAAYLLQEFRRVSKVLPDRMEESRQRECCAWSLE
jgi:hypothetical protein